MKILPIKLLFILFLFSGLMYAQENPPTAVDEMPRFPGCENMNGTALEKQRCAEMKMLEFIYHNITYPKIARENGIEGMVVVSFIVETDGSLSNAKILRDLGGGCGKESLRIVNQMPDWTPGKDKGELVRVQFNLPVRFKLEGSEQPQKQNTELVTFTLKNVSRKTYQISTPSGLITLSPKSYQRAKIKKGVRLMYAKKSKTKQLLIATTELEGKTIDVAKSIKKGRLIIQ